MDIISYALSKKGMQQSVSDYLDEHLTNPTNPPLDTSLTIANAAADSKATGDKLSELKEDLSEMQTATEEDVGKALKVKTVTDGKVTEWEFGETGVAVDPTLTIDGMAADAKATGDKINAINQLISTESALVASSKNTNKKYEQGIGLITDYACETYLFDVSAFSAVKIVTEYTRGDEANHYPNIVFLNSSNVEVSCVYIGTVHQEGYIINQSVPSGATQMYFVNAKTYGLTVYGISSAVPSMINDIEGNTQAIADINAQIETTTALTVNVSKNNYRYKYGTGLEYNTSRLTCLIDVTGYDAVEITSKYTYGDETNLYPNIIFFSDTPSVSTEMLAVYLGDIAQDGWSIKQSVPSGAKYMYFVTLKGYTSATATGIHSIGGRTTANEIDIASLKSRMIFNVANDGYDYYTNVLRSQNIYTSTTEYTGGSTSSDGRCKYRHTSPFANPSAQHIVYFGSWVKSTANAIAYVLVHNNAPTNVSEDYDGGNSELSYKLSKTCISKKEIVADTWTFVGGTILTNGGGSNAMYNSVCICCCYADATTASGATMTIKEGVFIDLTNAFGEGCEPTFDGMKLLLSGATDYYITTEYNIFNAPILKGVFERANKIVGNYNLTPSVEVDSTEQQIKMNSVVNPAWNGWTHPQYSYAMNKNLAPVNANIHGGFETDSYMSVVPLWGPWTENGYGTTCIWGGHIFHGWNSAMTYRLTMMASGNMSDLSDPNYVPREDEFCIQVFSPSSCYDNPVGLTEEQAADRVERDPIDRLKGNHYYGRIRIGSDDARLGFVFQARLLTCYGDVDMNGKKLILGTQNVPASATASGKAGQISYDTDYMYICVADNTWKRIPLQTW